jgi:hypothetical protein
MSVLAGILIILAVFAFLIFVMLFSFRMFVRNLTKIAFCEVERLQNAKNTPAGPVKCKTQPRALS